MPTSENPPVRQAVPDHPQPKRPAPAQRSGTSVDREVLPVAGQLAQPPVKPSPSGRPRWN